MTRGAHQLITLVTLAFDTVLCRNVVSSSSNGSSVSKGKACLAVHLHVCVWGGWVGVGAGVWQTDLRRNLLLQRSARHPGVSSSVAREMPTFQ